MSRASASGVLSAALAATILSASSTTTTAFVPSTNRPAFQSTALSATSPPKPSKVVDIDEPTPESPPFEPPIVKPSEIEEMMAYDESSHAGIDHQPWRRGELNGCGDPVDAQWRLEAEYTIEQAAGSVGGYVEDVTWYATFVVVTLSPNLDTVIRDTEEGEDKMGLVSDIRVDVTNSKSNVFLDGPEDENDPAGKDIGAFGGEEYAGSADDEDDDEDYEPEYDEETGEEIPRVKVRPSRAEAIFAYMAEKEEAFAKRVSTDRLLKLPGFVQPHNVKESVQIRYDGYVKDIEEFEDVLEKRYGYSLRPQYDYDEDGEPIISEPSEDDLTAALKLCNIGWGLEPSRLEEYKQYILEKYRVVEEYQGANPKLNDLDVRADGITQDYAERLGLVGKAIIDALEDEEIDAKLDVAERHEIVLTSANFDPQVVETQREFDNVRGRDVFVHTRDPWDSNRVLKGKLMDRNVLDIIINQNGRMVTIPNNMVEVVRLPDTKAKDRQAVKYLVDQMEEQVKSMEQTDKGSSVNAQLDVTMQADDEDFDEYDEDEYEEDEYEDEDEDELEDGNEDFDGESDEEDEYEEEEDDDIEEEEIDSDDEKK